MTDLISRQSAIKAICEDSTWLESQGCTDIWMAERKQRDVDILSGLPSIDAVPAEKYVPERNVGEWDMFELITSAYYGKTMYFKQDNGIVYSRYSCKYMSVDEAIREFLALIGAIE